MLLPQELILQILLWLRVKSLVRFKCVCKSWFSLISHDSHFANSHFHFEYFLLKANTLKKVKGLHFPYVNRNIHEEESRGGSLYNGVIHWLAFRNDL